MKLSNKQIDDIFGESPFCARGCWHKLKSDHDYEVVKATNSDWREVITNSEPEHYGYFDTYDEAETVRRRLHARWVLTQQ